MFAHFVWQIGGSFVERNAKEEGRQEDRARAGHQSELLRLDHRARSGRPGQAGQHASGTPADPAPDPSLVRLRHARTRAPRPTAVIHRGSASAGGPLFYSPCTRTVQGFLYGVDETHHYPLVYAVINLEEGPWREKKEKTGPRALVVHPMSQQMAKRGNPVSR
jgi:hypothetical protein